MIEHVRHVARDDLALRHLHPPRRLDDPGGLVVGEAVQSREKHPSALPEGGRKRYALTAEGREYVTAHADEVRAPWDDVASSVGTDAIELRRLIAAVAAAAVQVAQVGTAAQVAQSQQILTDARRKLYAILAADEDDAQ